MVTVRSRGKLPHWEAARGIYFVTFRLSDSLPRAVVEAFEFERRNIVSTANAMRRDLSSHERKRLAELFGEKIESYLDAGSGSCFLAKPDIASKVAEALRHFHGVRYRLFAWCVMPNHVYVVFQPFTDHTLARVLHTWKSYTAKEANHLLAHSGDFWQREYHDHLIRDEAELRRTIQYVLRNPQKAGLRNWLWMGATARE